MSQYVGQGEVPRRLAAFVTARHRAAYGFVESTAVRVVSLRQVVGQALVEEAVQAAPVRVRGRAHIERGRLDGVLGVVEARRDLWR